MSTDSIILSCHVTCKELKDMVCSGTIYIPFIVEIDQMVQKLILGRNKLRD